MNKPKEYPLLLRIRCWIIHKLGGYTRQQVYVNEFKRVTLCAKCYIETLDEFNISEP